MIGKRNISILGCGWLGMPLGRKLVDEGYHVKGSTTSPNKIPIIQSLGIEPYLFNIDDYDMDTSHFLNTDILIIAIPSKNVEGFKRLLKKLKQSSIRKVLFISSTSVYSASNAEVTEQSTTNETPLANIEKEILECRIFNTTILRFGGLFGYDRKPGRFIKRSEPNRNPTGYVNLIHRDDGIAVIQEIIRRDIWGEIFNVCADSHPTRRAFYRKEAMKIGFDDIEFVASPTDQYKIVSSTKLMNTLEYQFQYADLMAF